MKHFMCTQTFDVEVTKKAYFDTKKEISSKEWFTSFEGEQQNVSNTG